MEERIKESKAKRQEYQDAAKVLKDEYSSLQARFAQGEPIDELVEEARKLLESYSV